MKTVENPVEVLYIVGSGHSGSTLLDIALGNHSDIQSVGELENLPRGGWLGEEYCGCREQVRECPFWTEVRRLWAERTGGDVAKYLALQQSLTRFRHWPRLLREQRSSSAHFGEYAARTRALFEAIREASGKRVIVDSSKSPPRAYALSLMPGIDLRLVHLVRDGRGVTASYKKSWQRDLEAGVTRDVRPRSVLRTSAEWNLLNLESEWLRSCLSPRKSVRIHYESFVSEPERWMAEIGRVAGVDLTATATKIAGGKPLSVGHNVAGNHLRMSSDLRLEPDAGRWGKALSEREQGAAWALMGWLLQRYGYR